MRGGNPLQEDLLLISAPARAGNHLLRGLLDGHPELLLPPDEDFFVRQLLRSRFDRFRGWWCRPQWAPGFFQHLQKQGHFERVNQGRSREVSGAEQLIDLDRYYSYVSEHHRPYSISGLIRTHFGALEAALGDESDRKPRVKVLFCAIDALRGDIINFGRALSPLYRLKAIFVFRDPRALFASLQRRNPKARLRLFCRRQNEYWRQVNRFEREYDPALRVTFDSLAQDTERAMREICSFIGIDWRDELTQFTQNGKATWSNSSFQKTQGIDQTTLNRYRQTLPPETIASIEKYCVPELFSVRTIETRSPAAR